MKKTGIKATKQELATLRRRMSLPVMYLSGGQELAGPTALQLCHQFALKHGLPEISGYYGLDEDDEFVTV